jgi:cation:H+ antiporter
VIGSNLFNILAIMGITSLVAPGPIPVPPSLLSFDLIVMLCAALVLAYFAWSGSIGRRWGLVLLAGYGLYIAALFELPALTGTAAGVGS